MNSFSLLASLHYHWSQKTHQNLHDDEKNGIGAIGSSMVGKNIQNGRMLTYGKPIHGLGTDGGRRGGINVSFLVD